MSRLEAENTISSTLAYPSSINSLYPLILHKVVYGRHANYFTPSGNSECPTHLNRTVRGKRSSQRNSTRGKIMQTPHIKTTTGFKVGPGAC